MKKFLSVLFICFTLSVFSQVPQYINYQGVARDGSGNILTTAVGIKFQIYQGSVGGTLVYEETNNATPSSAGIFTVHIGGGTPVTGTFNSIGWGGGPYFLQVSIDPAGGTSYSTVGASQLVSVPYSLFAEKAGNVINYNAGNGISISSGSITNTAPNQTVNISGTGVTGSYPNYSITPSGSSYTAGSGIAVGSGTITNTAPDLTVTLTPSTNVNVSGAYPNFTVSSTPSLSIAGNSLSISGGNGVLIPSSGTFVATPNTSLTSTGYATITPIGTNTFNISVPAQTLNLVGNTISISYGNSIVLPAPPAATITGSGIAAVSPTTGALFNVSVPPVGMTYLPSTGVLTYSPAPGSSTINLSPALSFTNTILSVGSNTVPIPGTGLWSRTTLTATTLSNVNDFVGIGTNTPGAKLEISSPSFNVLNLRTTAGNSNVNIDAFPTGTGNLQLRTTSANGISLVTSNIDRVLIGANGKVGIGTNTPNYLLDLYSNTSAGLLYLKTNLSGTQITMDDVGGTDVYLTSTMGDFDIWTGGNNRRVTVTSAGNVGISNATPSTKLHVNGQVTIADGTQGDGKILVSNTSGNSSWKKGSAYTYFYPTATGMTNIGGTAVQVTGMAYSFTKQETGTTLEIDFIGHMSANGVPAGGGVVLEIRVDGNACTSFSGRSIYWSSDSPNFTNLVTKGIVENLAAGTHTVQIWVSSSGGITSSAFVNPGNWADQIIVKETH